MGKSKFSKRGGPNKGVEGGKFSPNKQTVMPVYQGPKSTRILNAIDN